jgi:hypothetical protein
VVSAGLGVRLAVMASTAFVAASAGCELVVDGGARVVATTGDGGDAALEVGPGEADPPAEAAPPAEAGPPDAAMMETAPACPAACVNTATSCGGACDATQAECMSSCHGPGQGCSAACTQADADCKTGCNTQCIACFKQEGCPGSGDCPK